MPPVYLYLPQNFIKISFRKSSSLRASGLQTNYTKKLAIWNVHRVGGTCIWPERHVHRKNYYCRVSIPSSYLGIVKQGSGLWFYLQVGNTTGYGRNFLHSIYPRKIANTIRTIEPACSMYIDGKHFQPLNKSAVVCFVFFKKIGFLDS